jgi:hypothetical protein
MMASAGRQWKRKADVKGAGMRMAWIGVPLALLSFVTTPSSANPPPGLKLPMLVWNVNFNRSTAGQPPRPMTKEQIEAAGTNDWAKPPLATYIRLLWVSRRRTAIVEKEALGFKDQPVVFTVPDPGEPYWGPQMWFALPTDMAQHAKRIRVTLDASMATLARMGGFTLWDVAYITFFEDGTIRAGDVTELARYRPNTPVHFECEIAVPAKQVTIIVDDHKDRAVTVPWHQPRAPYFSSLGLEGIMPGGHGYPGRIAFNHIRLTLEEIF